MGWIGGWRMGGWVNDSYNYTPFASCHSLATKKGIVMTECIRLLRTCKFKHDYERGREFFRGKLKARGYPAELIAEQFERAEWQDKARLLKPRAKVENKIAPF